MHNLSHCYRYGNTAEHFPDFSRAGEICLQFGAFVNDKTLNNNNLPGGKSALFKIHEMFGAWHGQPLY